MARTIRTKIYHFTELTPLAQSIAINAYRERQQRNNDYAWQRENIDTLKAFARLFDINVHQGIPRFDIGTNALELTGQRLATYLWNNYKTNLYKGKYYYAKTKSRYSRVTLERSCVLTGFCMDEVILEPIYAFMANPDNRCFKTLLNDCLSAWERGCEQDREDQDSELCIAETIIANECEYTKDGKHYY